MRYRQLKEEGFFEKNSIDSIFVFGGTNDSWAEAPLGEVMLSGWEEKDLFCVLPAICYFAYILKTDMPEAEIVFLANTGIKDEIRNCFETAAKHFGYSTEYFSKMFKHAVGKNFLSFLNTTRAQQAKKMLTASDRKLSLQEICTACGFNNTVSMYRNLKRLQLSQDLFLD